MDSFEIPEIPKIFVPHKEPIKSESPKAKISKSPSTLSNGQKEVSQSCQESALPSLPPPPQLCASCSQILLSYFVPLQQYVNEVVQIARGQQGTAPPALTLPNTDTLSHASNAQISNQANENPVSHQTNQPIVVQQQQQQQQQPQQYSSNYSHSERGQTESHTHDTSNRVTNNEPANRFNQNNNYQTQIHGQTENNAIYNQNYDKQTSSHGNQIEGNVDNRNEERSESNATYPQSHTSQTEDSPVSRSNNNQNDQTNTGSRDNRSDSNQQTGPPPKSDKSSPISENEPNRPDQSNVSQNYRSDRQSEQTEHGLISSPFAFVTIAYNNLSATNAIILANSLLLTNNRSMSYVDESGNKNIIQVPFVILLGGNIDPVLKDAIFMVFDEVISQPMDVRVALLSDESFGIQQYKLQLWKELQNYKKCLYLESSTMAVGRVTNLFEECQELSACVDWLFPDNFNCSVFVFEPNMTTYEQIISFALFHQKCSAQKDEGLGDSLDEMTLLNQFFAPKWKRISFIYNFVRNDAVYTQIPAFMKYGDTIRIVNFGHMMSQSSSLGNQSGLSSIQPWHAMFDLLASNQKDVISATSVDNYSKFYLNCFIKRLWPILQNHLTPLLMNRYGVGRREWSIFELVRLLTSESGIETDDHMFTQTPITLRRIKSPAEKIAQYDNLSIDDDEYLSDNFNADNLSEADSESKETLSDEQTSIRDQTEETTEEPATEEPLSPGEQDERSKREWEAGRIDWMGAHQSDKIISRLKKLIRND